MNDDEPGVGVATIIWQDEKKERLLLVKGLKKDIPELYTMPGGLWKSNETLPAAVKRVVENDVELKVDRLEFVGIHDFFRTEKNRKYISVWFQSILNNSSSIHLQINKPFEWCTPEEALELTDLWYIDKILIEKYRSGIPYEIIE